jgi:hypothetical protein
VLLRGGIETSFTAPGQRLRLPLCRPPGGGHALPAHNTPTGGIADSLTRTMYITKDIAIVIGDNKGDLLPVIGQSD